MTTLARAEFSNFIHRPRLNASALENGLPPRSNAFVRGDRWATVGLVVEGFHRQIVEGFLVNL
ncbi:hypothetical protein R6H26_10695 [Altericista sp. CCNU0014]